MCSEQRRAPSLPSASYVRSVNWYRRPHSRRWQSLLSTNRWTTGMWNSTLVGIPAYSCADCTLQSALNAAGRLIFRLRRSDHVTDALVSLHWLRVPERIQFEIAVLTYRVLHGDAPQYLMPFTSATDVPGRWTLRSAGNNRLVVPPVRLSTVGSRAFPVAVAQIWNSLPEHIVSAPTLQSLEIVFTTTIFLSIAL